MYQHSGIDLLRDKERALLEIESPDDVIIRLKAVGLDDRGIGLRDGDAGDPSPLPQLLDAGGAGIVVAVGSAVKNLKSGAAVCLYPCMGCGQCEYCASDQDFMCAQLSGPDLYSKLIRAPARNCFAIPAGFSFEQAAAFPTAFLAAWRMLVTNSELRPGQWVLIVDIGTSVTTAALQVAKHVGARTIVTSTSDDNLAKARELGADYGINGCYSDFADEVRRLTAKRGVDVVVDSVGGDGWVKSLAALCRGGRLVTCGATSGTQPKTNLQRVFWNNLKILGSIFGSRHEFHQVLNFLEASRSQPAIDTIMPLTDLAKAQQRVNEGTLFGKIVFRIEP